jgi:tetratricopeptide (TPR) repeat protein
MDGRMLRRWCMLGCVLTAAVGCGDRSAKQSPFGQMPDSSGTQVVQMPVGQSRSLFGGGSGGASVPVEMASPDVTSKKPPSADTIVKIADTQLEAAFDERTAPGSKQALLDTARTGYQKALQQDPKSKSALLGMARYYVRVEDHEKSLEMFKKYLTLYKDADVAHEVAIVHARWHDMNGAVAWCEYALKIDPEKRAVKEFMGFCLAMGGKWDEAFAALCQIMPEAEARHNLAGLLDHMGYTDACKQQLQLAMKADPNAVKSAGFLSELEHPTDPNPVRQAGDAEPAP